MKPKRVPSPLSPHALHPSSAPSSQPVSPLSASHPLPPLPQAVPPPQASPSFQLRVDHELDLHKLDLAEPNVDRKRLELEEACGVQRLGPSDEEKAFEVLVVGCGGGPLETNLSSYLLKPYSTAWSEGCTAIEGGSTLGALAKLIEDHPYSFTGFGLQIGVDANEQEDPEDSPPSSASGRKRPVKRAVKKKVGVGREGGGRAAGKVWDMVRCFAISHAHLDHIQGLIISSGASLEPRPLYGTSRTLGNIDRIFDGGVWPRLAGWESDGVLAGRAYLYRDVPAPTKAPLSLSQSLSFHAFPVSHGLDPSKFHRKPPPPPPKADASPHPNGTCEHTAEECYDSTAFFIKESITGKEKEFLFFGDVEPDSISKRPLNLEVWKVAAPKIVNNKLGVIFLECSYPTTQPADKLWGHLSPPYLFEELLVLAELVKTTRRAAGWSEEAVERLPLAGVTIVIIHIKDDILSLPPATVSPTTPTSPSRPNSPRRPTTPRRSLLPHSPLSMSPPVPSIPIRRASGGGYFPGASAFARRKSMDVSQWDSGRRASMPWNIGGGFGGAIVAAPGAISTTNKRPPFLSSESGSDPFGSSSLAAPPSEADSIEEEELEEETVHERIERELNEIEEGKRTGVRFLRAEQGMRIVF